MVQKRGIEKMLEGELDGHLGYNKNEKSDNQNVRNGYSEKNLHPLGEKSLQVPRARVCLIQPNDCPQ